LRWERNSTLMCASVGINENRSVIWGNSQSSSGETVNANRWYKFDGNVPHCALDHYGARRMSIVYFCHGRWLNSSTDTRNALCDLGIPFPEETYMTYSMLKLHSHCLSFSLLHSVCFILIACHSHSHCFIIIVILIACDSVRSLSLLVMIGSLIQSLHASLFVLISSL